MNPLLHEAWFSVLICMMNNGGPMVMVEKERLGDACDLWSSAKVGVLPGFIIPGFNPVWTRARLVTRRARTENPAVVLRFEVVTGTMPCY